MSKLEELRAKVRIARDKEATLERAKAVAIQTITNFSGEASLMHNLSKISTEEQAVSLASTLAETVTNNILDPVSEFIDTCKTRGLSDYEIKDIVNRMCQLFSLADPKDDDKDKMEVCALYLKQYPNLYEDFVYLTKKQY